MKRSDPSTKRPNGFTLVELLVVIGIAMLLSALLLPAVARARSRALDAVCQRRLQGIGLALANHESENGCFPSALSFTPGVRLRDNRTVDAVVHIALLPYLERSDFYDAFNLAGEPAAVSNMSLASVRIGAFLCPAEPSSVNRVNYRANAGSHPYYGGERPSLGAFPYILRRNNARDFVDGLARTAMFSERVAGDNDPDHYSPFQDIFVTKLEQSWTLQTLRAHCAGNTLPNPDHLSDAGGAGSPRLYWFYGGAYAYQDGFYMHGAPPNSIVPDCGDLPSSTGYMFVNARSWHGDTVNVLFGDGSVRSVSDSIDADVWRALGERDDGLPLSP